MDVLIRKALASDEAILYHMLCDLESEVLALASFKYIFQSNLQKENIGYFIAEVGGQPVGMASCHIQLLLHHAAAVGEIQEMYVDPTVRSMGIGKALIQSIFEFAGLQGANQVEVTSNKVRIDTHRFYEREGFQKTHDKLVWYRGN